MSESRPSIFSRRTRGILSGVVSALLILMAGDRASTSPIISGIEVGIDPLDILRIQSRPNILLVLSTASTMSDTLNSPSLPSASRLTLGGDHPRSKLAIAKQTIRQFITDNQTTANFQLGIYEQPAGTLFIDNAGGRLPQVGGVPAHRFIYTTTDVNATNISANVGQASLTASGNIVRDPATDNVIDAGGATLFRLWAGRFFNGSTIQVSSTGAFCATSAGSATNPATVTLQQLSGACGTGVSVQAVFTFYGVAGDWGNPAGSCAGHLTKLNLASCSDADQLTDFTPFIDPQIKVDTAASNLRPIGYPSPDNVVNPAITTFGLINGGHQPIAETLIDLKTQFNTLYTTTITSILPVARRPKTAVILITDGDDTCVDSATPDTTLSSTTLDDNALRAAHKAQQLFTPISATDPASSVPTFVVGYGAGVSLTRANWIAYGGSGLTLATTGAGASERWATAPTPAQVAACPDCQQAYDAPDGTRLYASLLDAVAQAANSGQFSASPSIVATVFELVEDPDGAGPALPISAFDPATRYNQRVNIFFQSTFDLPLWRGRMFALRNDGTFLPAPGANTFDPDGGGPLPPGIWEPGATLFENVITRMRTTSGAAGVPDHFTFAELHAGATATGVTNTLSTAIIRRRVFTTSRNGVWPRDTSSDSEAIPVFNAASASGTNVVALWPPNQTGLNTNPAFVGSACATDGVDPADPTTAGCLDGPLGVAGLTLTDYQSIFGACEQQPTPDSGFGNLSTGDPNGCLDPSPARVLQAAQKEARQVLLAYIAGAVLARGTDGQPLRSSLNGALIFESRDWLLSDTQFAAAAIATPPLRFEPSAHVSEFTIYRDGTRDVTGEGEDKLQFGFGLRNPDFDNANPAADVDLKPVMTVVYLGTNDRLHALRGGPRCPTLLNGTTAGCSPADEQGSEELWSFIPFDLLGKQKELFVNRGQTRSPHTYAVAASIRVASVFVPSQDSGGYIINGAPFLGRWRTVLYFGRGPGGKYVSSIDVTSPGPFTRHALLTNPPFVMWSRGNPDTTDGVNNGCTANFNGDSTDCQFYRDMGQTWSTPAIGNVDPTTSAGNCTSPVEWRVWIGSGYGAAATEEGKRFYELDSLTGDVCRTGPFTTATFLSADTFSSPISRNALVAAPAAYNPRALNAPGDVSRIDPDQVKRVYIGDLRGRMWRWSVTSGTATVFFDAGAAQPIANAAALLKMASGGTNTPHVFFETGNDNRVPNPTSAANAFKMFGIADPVVDNAANPSPIPSPSPFVRDFPLSFVAGLSGFQPFRGTVQPATAFNEVGKGRVFYAGTRFVPPGDVSSCAGSFETILFALSASTGGAVYDFSGDGVADLYATMTGNKTTGIQVVGGALVVGQSGSLANAPTPTPNPSGTPSLPPPPAPAFVTQTDFRMNSAVCRN